jgi:hypothetical protein
VRNTGALFQPPSLAAFCLTAATYTAEQYCRRRLYLKRHFEHIEFYGDPFLPLREYPVRKILAVYAVNNEKLTMNKEEVPGPEFYRAIPDCGDLEDIPFYLPVSPAARLIRGAAALKVRYAAGYAPGEVPADLASACLELAAWNMSRYRGTRIGMTGNVRGTGKDGEHLESSMPENVRLLLEPYRRKTI